MDLQGYEKLKKELQEERTQRALDQKARIQENERLTLQIDSFKLINKTQEHEKAKNQADLGERVRIIRDAPLDTLAIILVEPSPSGY